MDDPWADSRLSAHAVPRSQYQPPTYYPPTYNPQGQPSDQQAHYYGGELRHDICIIILIRTWIRTAAAAHWQVPTAQVPIAVYWQVPTSTEVPTAAQVPTMAQVPTTAQIPTAAQVPTAAQEDLDN